MNKDNIRKYKNVPIKIAADYMGISQPMLRILLQRKELEIGFATKLNGNKYSYYINPNNLINYVEGSNIK